MTQPTKEKVRKWQEKNRQDHRPPVSPEQAKRELGWDLVRAQQKKNKK
jgi:hypothetical protein